jgi:hypothetical protein
MMPRDAQLLAAHAAGDSAALVDLYLQAAEATPDANKAAFFLTHAHVFALECAHPSTDALRATLIRQGRETPLAPPLPPRR